MTTTRFVSHPDPHPWGGQILIVLLDTTLYEFTVEDWADRVRPEWDWPEPDLVYGRLVDPGEPDAVALSRVFRHRDLLPPGWSPPRRCDGHVSEW